MKPVKKCGRGKHLNKKTNRCNKNKKKKRRKRRKTTHTKQYQKQSQNVVVHIHEKKAKKKQSRAKPKNRSMNLKNYGNAQQLLIQPTSNYSIYQRVKTEQLKQGLKEQGLQLEQLNSLIQSQSGNKVSDEGMKAKIKTIDAMREEIEAYEEREQRLKDELPQIVERAGQEQIQGFKQQFKSSYGDLKKMSKEALRAKYEQVSGEAPPSSMSRSVMASAISQKELIFN